MAEGFLNYLFPERFIAYSAGTEPTEVNPNAVKVMAEIGIDISRNRSKSVYEFKNQKFDYGVTVCDHAKETCPFFPGGKIYLHRGFKDPTNLKGVQDEIVREFRKIRDEIKEWIEVTFGARGLNKEKGRNKG